MENKYMLLNQNYAKTQLPLSISYLRSAFAKVDELNEALQNDEKLSVHDINDAERALTIAFVMFRKIIDEIGKNCFPQSYTYEERRSEILEQGFYDVAIADNKLLVKAPICPRAFYRKPSRAGKAFEEPLRYPDLMVLLSTTELPVISGPKTLFLYHCTSRDTAPLRRPDIDNYDVKQLIDAILYFFDGDSAENLPFLLMGAGPSEAMSPGTYAVLDTLHDSVSMPEYIHLLASVFSEDTPLNLSANHDASHKS